MVHGPGDIPQLRRFIDDSSASEEQKRIERGKLDTLIGFTEATGCRRQVLLRHFGEQLADPCGNCDGCLEPQALENVSVPVQKLLSAVYRTGQRFGAAHVVDVLLGASTEKIRQLGHDQLSVYGIGRELDRGQWRALVRQLLSREVLQAPAEARGGLCFGAEERVRPLLRGEQRLELALPAPRREQKRGLAESATLPRDRDVDGPLLAKLKEWRREQARVQGVPPYVVFHDRTLVEVAARQPPDLEALAEVSGVGAAKLERYGEAVLALITTSCREETSRTS
jgi:ATP-dependent DNA helicase RecQ